MSRHLVMGIDVGTYATKTVIAEVKKGEIFPYILGSGLSPSHGLRKGCVVNYHDVANSIKNSVRKAQEKTGVNLKNALVSIGGAGIEGIRSKGSIVVSRADHEISENDVKRAINQSEAQLNRASSSYLLNREIIHSFPVSYKVDDELIIGGPTGMKGEKLEVETLFVTGPSQHLNNLVKSMDLAGVTVDDIAIDSWVTSHTLLNQKEKEVGCMLINIGADTSSVMVFEEGTPISMEVFPIGSNHITFDIARGFRILLEEAEKLKTSYGQDASLKRKLTGIIEPRLGDIFELAQGHLIKLKRDRLLPAGVILTGGGSNLSGIEEIAKKSLQLPVQLNQPNLSGTMQEDIKNPIWSVALGLCSIGLSDKEILFPPPKGILSKGTKVVVRFLKNFLP
jgi:cell division protein FtsA